MAIAPILLLQKLFRCTGRLPRRSFGPPRNDMRFLKVHRNDKLEFVCVSGMPQPVNDKGAPLMRNASGV